MQSVINTGKKTWKQWILLALLIAWMGMIFFFSAKPAVQSAQMSHSVGRMIGKLLVPEFDELEEQEQDSFAESIDFVVRKSAHACEYAVLGILLFWNYEQKIRKRSILAGISWLSVVAYAATDEIHQLFVPGRSGQISDVMLDSFGGLLGVVFSVMIQYLIRKRKKDGS